jgi:predicted transcriptional regulator
MLGLIAIGYSQADIARELGVTRQAIQKMLSLAPLPRTPAGEARKPAEMPDGPY